METYTYIHPQARFKSSTPMARSGFWLVAVAAMACLPLPSSSGLAGGESSPPRKLDWREAVLSALGIGEWWGLGSPVLAPDLTKCEAPPYYGSKCCLPPPKGNKIVNYEAPPPGPVRVRRAAHLLDEDYIAKYTEAVRRMKALPADDPRSFMQQADVHCAYCSGGYAQVGFPGIKLQIHYGWLFFPFHRWYLYFHERILGKLIGDPTFALPYWNFDHPDGMRIPDMYDRPDSSLYNTVRDPNHKPPRTVDVNYNDSDPYTPIPDEEQVRLNLHTMHRQLITAATTARLFLGGPFRAGGREDTANAGGFEIVPHNTVHDWVGIREPHNEDMGNFYSAARDPLFYAHHSNIDRLWTIWKTLGKRHRNFDDPDWLNSQFVFYDENARPVRVRVGDCLEHTRLGYVYEDAPLPWINTRPTPQRTAALRKKAKALAKNVPRAGDVFPSTLDRPVRVTVPKPKKSGSRREKEEEEVVLVIEGIEVDSDAFVKFDVYINEDREIPVRPDNTEFAGSFVSLPVRGNPSPKKKKVLRLGIGRLLEDLGAQGDDFVVVSLVPGSRTDRVITVGGVKIEFD